MLNPRLEVVCLAVVLHVDEVPEREVSFLAATGPNEREAPAVVRPCVVGGLARRSLKVADLVVAHGAHADRNHVPLHFGQSPISFLCMLRRASLWK